MFIFKKLCNMLNKQNTGRNIGNNNETTEAYKHLITERTESDDRMNYKNNLMNNKEPQMSSDTRQIAVTQINGIPSVYVDANILEQFIPNLSLNPKENKLRTFVYEINGYIFWENETIMREREYFLEFEIFDRLASLDVSVGVEAKENLEDSNIIEKQFYKSKDESLPIAIQKTPHGLIINSSILVTENAWNMIINSGVNPTCVACNKNVDTREIAQHIGSDDHQDMLDKFKPLKQFDINIVRLVNDKYHCGICNIVFDVENIHHLESVLHGDKVLTAINKLSDITETDNDNNIFRNGNRNRDNDCIDLDVIGEDGSGIEMNSCDGFYDDVSVNDFTDSETDSCQQSNTCSYADIAKKPKIYETSKYVHLKLDDNYAKITFDSYHMIIILKMNNYYCMACKEDGPVRFKVEHCLKVNHVENLLKCNIIRDYKDHVIRKVDDKFYHCGHCNNLHMIHEIKNHIDKKHIRKTTNINKTEKAPLTNCTVIASASRSPTVNSPKNNTAIKSKPDVANNNAKIAENKSNEYTVTSINKQMVENVVDDRSRNNLNQVTAVPPIQQMNVWPKQNVLPTVSKIMVREFGRNYCIPLLAYNFIQQRMPNGYFCCICDIWCMNDARNHIMDPIHTARLAQTPFLLDTSFHLIRRIKYGFHCTVCNICIQNNPINHTWDRMHLSLLSAVICDPPPPMLNRFSAPIFYQNISVQNIVTPEVKANDNKEENVIEIFDNRGNEQRTDNGNKATALTDEKDFDTEEHMYVKVKNNYTKITMTSYNTLVQTGNGARYCVLCSLDVFFHDLKAHINSPKHLTNMEKCNFLNKYERHLLRQMSTCYHCALCNVCVIQGSLNDHISWPLHKETEANKVAKHIRRNEIKAGLKNIECSTQNEIVVNNMKNEFQVLMSMEFRPAVHQDIVKKKKIVIVDGVILKISWDGFHGIIKQKNGYKCLICQTNFKNYELSAHTGSSQHVQKLEDFFQLQFSPALIRKINDSTLHCLTCNLEVVNESHSITDHLSSKRHVKNYTKTVADTSHDDIDKTDILTLTCPKSIKKK